MGVHPNYKLEVQFTVDQQTVNLESLDIQPADYLATGSKALEVQFQLYDAAVTARRGLLQEGTDRLEQKKLQVQIFALLIAALAIYVFIAYARNLALAQTSGRGAAASGSAISQHI
ncbi:MAG: hypothetical protein MUC60_10940 [Oscillatoria sp. Prado101]|nr:hypothetical protein [Oscillatoria sp. Prado101]